MADPIPTTRDAMPRRSFFAALTAAGSAWIGAWMAIPLVRAALFPLRNTSGQQIPWSDMGPVENFTKLTTPLTQPVNVERGDGWEHITAEQTVYVVAGPGSQPRVLSSVCPHLGCTVQWRAQKDQFICPCHNGTYSPDGERVSGPPARGMDELPTRIQDGHLYVQCQSFRQLLPTKEAAD
jgi:menaquinol-cytochrome c reductase iron-sulfur subunit